MTPAPPSLSVRRIASCPDLQLHVCAEEAPSVHIPRRSLSASAVETSHTRHTFHDILDDNMDDDPGSHFLADASCEPYECRFGMWEDSDDEDGDDDDDDYELNPNIIDFTLFSDAARRAKETQQPLGPQWDRLIQSQQGAYERTLERTASYPITVQRPRFLQDLPDLTPDSSPQMRDDRETIKRPIIPQDRLAMPPPGLPTRPKSFPTGLHIRYAPDQPIFHGMEMDEEELNSLYLPESAYLAKRVQPISRPGLIGSHTLSGHSHSWRRPSFELPTVSEESETKEDEDVARGRRRSQ